MRSWMKRTLLAAAATAAIGGAAVAAITPGSEAWHRVMDIKLRAQDIQLRAGEAASKTEDSHARATYVDVVAKAKDIFDRCEALLDGK